MSLKMKSILIAMNLDTRERRGGTGGLNMMTDYCTQGSYRQGLTKD